MTDEDRDWLEALAGRTPTGTHRAAIREGQRLRELIQRNVQAPDVTVPEQDAEREAPGVRPKNSPISLWVRPSSTIQAITRA